MGIEEHREDISLHKMGACISVLNESCYICCCAGFLNPNGEGSDEFYEAMGLGKEATHAEIRKSWKKLSLQFHPDKLAQRGESLTDEMRDKFRTIKRAHEVLSDPERRKIYDSLGINGILLKEEPEQFMRDPSKLQDILAKADWRATLIVYFVVSAILGYLLSFPLLFALEADDTIDIAWFYVFFPLWILYAIILMILLGPVLAGPTPKPEGLEEDEEWTDPNPLSGRLFHFVMFCLFVTWNAMLCARLDYSISCNWIIALIPYFVWDIINLISELRTYYANVPPESTDQLTVEQQEDYARKQQLHLQSRDASRYTAARLWQVLFVVLKVDNTIDWTWWLVLMPSWLYIFNLTGLSFSYRNSSLEDPENDFYAGKAYTMCSTCCCLLFFGIMLCAYLDEAASNRFSFFWFYLPFGIIFGIPVLCILCVIPVLQLIGLVPKEFGESDTTSGDEDVGNASVETGNGSGPAYGSTTATPGVESADPTEPLLSSEALGPAKDPKMAALSAATETELGGID